MEHSIALNPFEKSKINPALFEAFSPLPLGQDSLNWKLCTDYLGIQVWLKGPLVTESLGILASQEAEFVSPLGVRAQRLFYSPGSDLLEQQQHKRIGVCKSLYGNVCLNKRTFSKPPCMLRTRLTI